MKPINLEKLLTMIQVSTNKNKYISKMLFSTLLPSRIQSFTLFCLLIMGVQIGQAQIEASLTTGSYFVIDNQGCAMPGPRAAYVGIEICNNSGGALSGLTAEINLTTIEAGTDPFALAGGQPVSQVVGNGGSLADGACDVLYWYVTYPCDLPVNMMGTDIYKEVSIAVDVKQNGTSQTVTGGSFNIQTKPNNSASSGGDVVSQTLSPGIYLGQILCLNVRYTFGNINMLGDILTMQPAGNVDFNAACYQVISSEVVFTENASGNPINSLFLDNFPLPAGKKYNSTSDQLAFEIIDNAQLADFTSNDNLIEIKYYIRVHCLSDATTANPYANSTSGNQEKYSNNYGSSPVSFTAVQNELVIDKSVDINSLTLPFTSTPEMVTYTITLTNNAPIPSGGTAADVAISVDNIRDVLPGNFTYHSLLGTDDVTEVTASNSSGLPSANDAGPITWTGGKADPTNIPFPFTSYYIPGGGGSISLTYKTNVPEEIGSFTNSATATIGATTVGPATATVDVDYACPNDRQAYRRPQWSVQMMRSHFPLPD